MRKGGGKIDKKGFLCYFKINILKNMAEGESKFRPEIRASLGEPSVERNHRAAHEALMRKQEEAREALEREEELKKKIEEIRDKFSAETAEAKRELEAAEREAKAYVSGGANEEMKDRLGSIKEQLKFAKKRYKEKAAKMKKWQEDHPFLAFAAEPLSWPPRVSVWFLEKVDNVVDGWFYKIEKWGDKNAPGWFKWAVDWTLWPIEKFVGRQTIPQADERAKGKREEKKGAEKLQKIKAKKEASGK